MAGAGQEFLLPPDVEREFSIRFATYQTQTAVYRTRPASPDSLLDVSVRRIMLMADAVIDLLKAHFRQLRLPTMSQEFEKLRGMPPRPIRTTFSSCSA